MYHEQKPCILHGPEDKLGKWRGVGPAASSLCESLLERNYRKNYKACPSKSGTEVGAPLFPAVVLCDFPGRWQCMSGDIWYTLKSGSVLLTEAEAR